VITTWRGLAHLAWRNLWRHARRSLITAGAMSVGMALCMASMALTDGMFAQLFTLMVERSLGHVQVHHPEWPGARSLYDTLPAAEATLARLDALPGTHSATGRLLGYGLAGGAQRSTAAQLIGVSPDRERAADSLGDALVAGDWLAPTPKADAVIGAGLAETLGIGVGGEIIVVTQASDGSLGNAAYTVRGLVRTGAVAVDDGSIYLHLSDLQELLVLPDQVHEITLVSADPDAIPAYRDAVRHLLGPAAWARAWWEVSPQTQQLFAMQAASKWIVLGLVFSVSAFGVVNTLLMSVFERTRELGVLLAIGMRPSRLVAMVLLEALLLAGLAVAMGLVLGGALDAWLVWHGLDFSASLEETGVRFNGVRIDPVMRGAVNGWGVVQVAASVVGVALGAALWPAVRAARLQPVTALRTE